ncbi:MAG: HU family DNA-binding protein [Prevotella sp.]|nr:HU family DNA-binding protein [Prevotella sp.]
MNNKEFINELARRNEMKAVDAQAWMNTLLGAMGDNFLEGNAVQLPNFGVFEVKKKLERIIINPSTGQRMLVPPKLTLAFKPTPQTKEKIKKGGEANG